MRGWRGLVGGKMFYLQYYNIITYFLITSLFLLFPNLLNFQNPHKTYNSQNSFSLMQSNKNSKEFSFPEALLVKSCPLFQDATNIVVGRGNPKSDILFIGEAPGKKEDEQGIPFCGAAGKNLDKLLKEVNLSIDEIYIANILKCRPPKNRDPTYEEIKSHTPWLLKQIKEMNPKIICSLGNYATKFFLAKTNIDEMKKQKGITELHGKIQNIEINGIKIKLIPLFHPAAIIYNRKLEPLWLEDMEIVKKYCKN